MDNTICGSIREVTGGFYIEGQTYPPRDPVVVKTFDEVVDVLYHRLSGVNAIGRRARVVVESS